MQGSYALKSKAKRIEQDMKHYQLPQRLFVTAVARIACTIGGELEWYQAVPITVAIFLLTFLALPDEKRE